MQDIIVHAPTPVTLIGGGQSDAESLQDALALGPKLVAADGGAGDLLRGNRLELPWLSGDVVRMGRESGVPTPAHAFAVAVLKLHADGRHPMAR